MKKKLTVVSTILLMYPAQVFSQPSASRLESASQFSGMAATAGDLDSSKLFAAKALEESTPSVVVQAAANASFKNSASLNKSSAKRAHAAQKRENPKLTPSPIIEMLTDGPARGFYGILGMALLIVGITALFPAGGGISLLGVGVFFAAVMTFHLVADYINKENLFAYRKKADSRINP